MRMVNISNEKSVQLYTARCSRYKNKYTNLICGKTAVGRNYNLPRDTQAYMYTYVDVEEVTHYLIVGGTPEEFGYAEFMKDATGTWVGGYFQGGVVGGDITPVWLENAKEQLDIPW